MPDAKWLASNEVLWVAWIGCALNTHFIYRPLPPLGHHTLYAPQIPRLEIPVIWISRPGVLESASHRLCGEENKGFPDRAQQLSARLGRQSTAAVVAYTVQDRCTLTHSQVNNRFQNCVQTFHPLTSPFSMLVTGSGVRKWSNFCWRGNCKLQLSEYWGKILDAALCNAAER